MESKKRKRKDNGSRLKVGRACYTCRAKKIKCDGLRPCMQCKARGIACSLYKDGSFETDDNQADCVQALSNSTGSSKTTYSTDWAAEQAIFFSETVDENHTKLKRKGPMLESRVSNMLACLGDVLKKTPSMDGAKLSEKLWPPAGSFGNFITWTTEPPLPSRYSGSIEMPSAQIQMTLIESFFHTRHRALQCIVPSYFYEQLKSKGLFITPLLLNAIYTLSARFLDIPDCPKSDIFFHRAKRLVEDFMDVPRLSTTVAMYLLSLYEPSPLVYRPGSLHCRHWIFSGTAFRMCIELGLYDENNVDCNLSPVETEQRRRVFWSCYILDKFQSGGWERPCMIRCSFIRIRLPSPLPEESTREKNDISVFIQRIKLCTIVEQDLDLRNGEMPNQDSRLEKDRMFTMYTNIYNSYMEFFYSLPLDMKWMADVNTPIANILQLSKPSSAVAQFYLHFNVLLIEALIKMPANESNKHQMAISAAAITQLSYHLCQEPSHILKLDAIAHSLIHAIKVHMLYLEDTDISVVQQAWFLFYRCIYSLESLNKHAVIPNCHKFLQQVLHIYGTDPFCCNSDEIEKKELTSMLGACDTQTLVDYTTEERVPMFECHQPIQLIQTNLWSMPRLDDKATVPSQPNMYQSWRTENQGNKTDEYLSSQTDYTVINNFP